MAKKKNTLLRKFKRLKRKTRKIILKIIAILILILLFIITYKIAIHIDYKINYEKILSDQGQELLDDYELPWYLVENDSCIRPYDVGDGVITFGPGVTYSTEKEGIEDINKKYNTEYTISNNCIDLDILFKLQKDIMYIYEDYVSKKTFEHRIKVTQNEFDALLLLAYNSPNFLKEEEVINMLKDKDHTKKEYISSINNYYKQMRNYYDNQDTIEPNDGFGQGWYNRITDSAEVFFEQEYEFQNNVL